MNTAKVLLVLSLLLVALVVGCNESNHAVAWRPTGTGWYVPDSLPQP
jgi:hypothetical protein